jgi:hypothetical protein
MKKLVLFILVVCSVSSVNAQTLKELLYSGKLKKDSTGIIRKTDDLSTKIDTTTKKTPVAEVAKPSPATTQVITSVNVSEAKADTVALGTTVPVTETTAITTADTTASVATSVKAAPAKSNTKILKEYSDALVAGLKDVLGNKKIKKETYFFMVDYELSPDGKVEITNVTSTPENSILLETVKSRIYDAPPVLNATPNATKNVKRKFNFSVTKD